MASKKRETKNSYKMSDMTVALPYHNDEVQIVHFN